MRTIKREVPANQPRQGPPERKPIPAEERRAVGKIAHDLGEKLSLRMAADRSAGDRQRPKRPKVLCVNCQYFTEGVCGARPVGRMDVELPGFRSTMKQVRGRWYYLPVGDGCTEGRAKEGSDG